RCPGAMSACAPVASFTTESMVDEIFRCKGSPTAHRPTWQRFHVSRPGRRAERFCCQELPDGVTYADEVSGVRRRSAGWHRGSATAFHPGPIQGKLDMQMNVRVMAALLLLLGAGPSWAGPKGGKTAKAAADKGGSAADQHYLAGERAFQLD